MRRTYKAMRESPHGCITTPSPITHQFADHYRQQVRHIGQPLFSMLPQSRRRSRCVRDNPLERKRCSRRQVTADFRVIDLGKDRVRCR